MIMVAFFPGPMIDIDLLYMKTKPEVQDFNEEKKEKFGKTITFRNWTANRYNSVPLPFILVHFFPIPAWYPYPSITHQDRVLFSLGHQRASIDAHHLPSHQSDLWSGPSGIIYCCRWFTVTLPRHIATKSLAAVSQFGRQSTRENKAGKSRLGVEVAGNRSTALEYPHYHTLSRAHDRSGTADDCIFESDSTLNILSFQHSSIPGVTSSSCCQFIGAVLR